jgi:ketosteroid isomerase-like protein
VKRSNAYAPRYPYIVVPDGTMFTSEMADVITVADDQIVAQRLYYDARSFAEAFGL